MSIDDRIKRLGLEHLKDDPVALKAAAQKIMEETAPRKLSPHDDNPALSHEQVRRDYKKEDLSMNRKQQLVLFIMALLVGAMILFPPYIIQWRDTKIVFRSGYAFIFNLPTEPEYLTLINVTMLAIPICGVLLVGGLLYLV